MKKTKFDHLKTDAATHAGLVGKQNEDRYAVTSYFVGKNHDIPATFAVLCDGIGGHRAGEVAAEMGVSIITEAVQVGDPSYPLITLRNAISRASRAIFQASQTDHGREGMGSTCACAWVIGNLLYTANLGDSRIYLMRKRHLVQLTTDHTWVQEALDAGMILDVEGENHPNAHVIRRYLGSENDPETDFRLWFFENESDADALENQGFRLEQGDVILLCSDGLTDLVSDEEIRDAIMAFPGEKVPNLLIDIANQRGGHDNTTIILMSFVGRPTSQRKVNRKRRWLVGCLMGLIAISAIAVAVAAGYSWWQGKLDGMEKSLPTEALTIPASFPMPEETVISSPTSEISVTAQPTPSTVPPQPTRTPWPTNTTSDG